MTKTEQADPSTDPFEVWRELYDANERAWTSALEEAMSSPGYDEASGKLLETMLAAQKSIRNNIRTYLETMNVPTREDIARLGELVIGLEEKIDQLIDSKRQLSEDLLGSGAELLLTEMKNDELLKLVALDLHAASQE